MANNRRAGVLQIQADGKIYDAAGDFSHNIGNDKNEALIGPSGVQGYKATPQVPFIEGDIRDSAELSLSELTGITDATIVLTQANGKQIMLQGAWYAGDGNVGTGEGTIASRFEANSGREI